MLEVDTLNRHVEAIHHLHEHAARARRARQTETSVDRFTIALSREAGVPVEEVAQEVSAQLAWPVYDHELLERIAGEVHCPVALLERLDERHHSWLLECLEGFSSAGLTQSQYVSRLVQLIHALGEEGRCIIIGRGAGFILPHHSTLRVHLIGEPEDRIAMFGRRLHLSRDEAERRVAEINWEQMRFVQDYFGSDPAKPRNYDLVLNTSEWSAGECANLILSALERKALHGHAG
jgi:cytidylate kinase